MACLSQILDLKFYECWCQPLAVHVVSFKSNPLHPQHNDFPCKWVVILAPQILYVHFLLEEFCKQPNFIIILNERTWIYGKQPVKNIQELILKKIKIHEFSLSY